ncbi:hypothetical protein [Methanopyrus sp. SNP6]|uniref:hypothetical protein n=1 Tax=Methanopyrus sp. SNP6 TaxID=1937005 RepID=UPI0011E5D5CB|nr:hypothetical protein [Methanopyrus sp. SNP6]
MDLAVQAHKVYLLGTRGLARGDWDPYSYTGRPPMIDYPILPFLPAVLFYRWFGDPYLACTLVDGIYRSLPCWIWSILKVGEMTTPKADAAMMVYAASVPFQVVEIFSTRVATTFSLGTAGAALILWRCGRNVLRGLPALWLWVLSLLGNPLYVLPALLLESIFMWERRFLLALLPMMPIAALSTYFLTSAFTWIPPAWTRASPWEHWVAPGLGMLCVVFAASRGGGSVLPVLPWPILWYTEAIIGPVWPLSQLDPWRVLLTAILSSMVVVERYERLRRIAYLGSGLSAVGFPVLALTVSFQPIQVHWESAGTANWRVLVTGDNGFEALSPEFSGKPVYSIAGAFYQGASEPQLQSLIPALVLANNPSACSYPYVNRWEFSKAMEVTRRRLDTYLRTLPIGYVDIRGTVVRKSMGIDHINWRGRPELTLNDAVPVERFKVLYVGSFSLYGILWMKLASALGRPPIVPVVYPWAVRLGQELDPSELPWTGDVLVVDKIGWREAVRLGLVKRAKVVIKVSGDTLPWPRGSDVDEVSARLVKYIDVVKGLCDSALRIDSDEIEVRTPERAEFVLIPWGWAPFWAVNGREGLVCPVGPYMLVKTDGKPAIVHYVGWERYQSRAYLASCMLVVLVSVAWVVGRKPL